MPSCSSMGLKVHLWATWIGQEFSDLNGAVLRFKSGAGWFFLFTFSSWRSFAEGGAALLPTHFSPEPTLPPTALSCVLTLLLSFLCRTYNSSKSGEGCQPETEERKQGKAVPALLSVAPSFWCSCQCCMSLSRVWRA